MQPWCAGGHIDRTYARAVFYLLVAMGAITKIFHCGKVLRRMESHLGFICDRPSHDGCETAVLMI